MLLAIDFSHSAFQQIKYSFQFYIVTEQCSIFSSVMAPNAPPSPTYWKQIELRIFLKILASPELEGLGI